MHKPVEYENKNWFHDVKELMKTGLNAKGACQQLGVKPDHFYARKSAQKFKARNRRRTRIETPDQPVVARSRRVAKPPAVVALQNHRQQKTGGMKLWVFQGTTQELLDILRGL